MDIKEEIELLERKLELLKEIQALQATVDSYPRYPVYPTYPTYPYPTYQPSPWVTTVDGTDWKLSTDATSDEIIWHTPESAKMPTRLEGLDPMIQDGMRQPCTFS